MKTRCIAILIALCMLVVLASAQPYSIRANRGLNLRAEPSRTASIAETIHSGTVLQVVGEFNRWLKIDRNGREVWLADWVDFSRVDGIAPPPSPALPAPTGPIDNCCYVDRQCHSELDWMAGWHAFQNGQCAAPAPPQPATPAQPVASAPANVDNCCLVDRQCSSDQEWMAGWHAYRHGKCPVFAPHLASARATGANCCDSGWKCQTDEDRVRGHWAYLLNHQCAPSLPQTSGITLTGPVPRIEGSDRFVQHIIASLKLLKGVDPAWYNYVITGMDVIVEEHGTRTQGHCTALAYNRGRRVTVESCWIDFDSRLLGVAVVNDRISTAAMLSHEACHIHTHEDGRYFATQADEEEECNVFGLGAIALLTSALAIGLDPRHGSEYFYIDEALSVLRQYCSEGYRADLFCPTLQKVEAIWRNVPYSVFPIDPPGYWSS